MPELGIRRENTVFVSGIGCSSRFPYYMNTYGMHSIHGRAPAIATGLSASRPDLSVWVVTGDGDALSIGGNHLIHALRRNVNLKILLFNNRIYGLTKGQYSPTSEVGKITKSTPMGSLDHPFNPLSLAIGAEATFVARTIDSDRQHLTSVLRAAAEHRGTALVEIYQNCNIFNDNAFEVLKDPGTRDEALIRLEHGQPVTFAGRGVFRGPGGELYVDEVTEANRGEVLVHDAHHANPAHAFALSRIADADTLHHTPIGGAAQRRAARLRRADGRSAGARGGAARPGATWARCSPGATPGRWSDRRGGPSARVVRLTVRQHPGRLPLDPVREAADQLGGLVAERGQPVVHPGRDDRVRLALDEAVPLQGLQGLGEHLLADPGHPAAQLAEPVLALGQRDQHQHAPAAGDVLQHAARGAHPVVDVRGVEQCVDTYLHVSTLLQSAYFRLVSAVHTVSVESARPHRPGSTS
ncbi:hypothetical protein GCM10020229_19110 [Kitasatospora albolonga]